jgi:putative SOS response-associated peptidase YedK
MCGRFTLRTPAAAVAEHFALLDVSPLAPRYNIAPSQPVAVVRLDPDAPEPRRRLAFLRWGLVPSWAKDPAIGNRLINARIETAAEKPAFRAAWRHRRCLIAADGFYEWRKLGARKQPYFIHLPDDGLFAFAGLWESWEGPGHAALETCTILTTEAGDLLRPIHDRMPVILPPESYARWLDADAGPPDELRSPAAPYPSDALEFHAVGMTVNSPANDGPQCLGEA